MEPSVVSTMVGVYFLIVSQRYPHFFLKVPRVKATSSALLDRPALSAVRLDSRCSVRSLFSLHTSGDEEYRPNEMASLMNYAEPGHALGVFRAGNESRLMAVVRRRHRHFSAAVSTTTTPSLSTQGTASTTQASTSSVTTESSTSRSVQTDESLGTSKPTTSAAGLGVNQLLLDLRIAFQKKRLGSNRFHIVHTPTGDVLKAERDGSLRFVSYAEINPRVPNDRQSIEFHTVKLPSRRALFEETCYKAPDQHNKAVTSSMPSNNTTPSTVAQ